MAVYLCLAKTEINWMNETVCLMLGAGSFSSSFQVKCKHETKTGQLSGFEQGLFAEAKGGCLAAFCLSG